MSSSFLVLDDGSVLEGDSFGYAGTTSGELVFTTGSAGYQEQITDPSYEGQILMFTYPLVGDYGFTDQFNQSSRAHVSAVVVREYCKQPSMTYNGVTIDKFLKEQKVPGISGIDTRELVLKTRENGNMFAAIVKDEDSIPSVISKLKSMKEPKESVSFVSTEKKERIENNKKITVALIDCGAKNTLIDELSQRFNVVRCPYDVSADEIIKSNVQGVVVSNGPGSPYNDDVAKTVDTIKKIADKLPIMGVSLGCELVAIALGAQCKKLKFGHRGGNQPVKINGKIIMTSQNHGYTLDEKSLKAAGLEVVQSNLNDGDVEGIKHKSLPIIGTLFFPCGDTSFLYDDFAKMMGAKQ